MIFGLNDVYDARDRVWSQDLEQSGGNSDWLLPNRVYEASWRGCPSIAVANTVTGQYVEENGLGFVLQDASVEILEDCIAQCWPDKAAACANELLPWASFAFQQSGQAVISALAPVLPKPTKTDRAVLG
jgi:succinoglycan biosynthesis protein ExoL